MLRFPVLWFSCALSVLWPVGGTVSAQTPASPTFDVASVKPVEPAARLQKPLTCGFGAGGKFMAYGWLRYLIACAYGIRSADPRQEIVDGPHWVDVDVFEIMANSPPNNIPSSQVEGLAMFRSLLAERFKLAVHRETKEVPMYDLVMAGRDGKAGPRLRPTAENCSAWIASGRRGAPPPVPGDLLCGRQSVGRSAFRSTAMSLSQLANLLSPRVERPVRDRSGLQGTFALDLQWRPEQSPTDLSLPDSLPTSIFTALQEQLGLKLESTRGAVDLLVIDHVEHPTED
jgi:uncharacterized protein (TIGR03435 family)